MSDQVDEIKSKIDIVEVINEFVPLKKTGRNFKACCPFHNEKTPSFVVSPERQIYHCFGCQEGGDVFHFLMKIENIEFPEALRILAKRAGITLKQFQPTREDQIKERLYEINHLASEFYHYLLLNHPIGKKALEYVLNRGITKKTIEIFKIGFAPNLWESVSKFLIKKGFKIQELETAGLVIKSDRRQNSYYDRFRGRIMFTLKDQRGNVVGFAGRVLDQDANEASLPSPAAQAANVQAKYINTPETPVYIKGNLLFGLDLGKDAIKKENLAIITEGEIDAISSFQMGIRNVVAIKGSALTENQVILLKRYTENIAFALDSDLAGDAAARRGIEIADQAGLNMRVIELLYGKDPDECIKKDPNLWRQSVKKAIPIYDYIMHSSTRRYDKNSPEGKRKISEEILPIINKITNEIVKSHYIKKIALLLGVSEEGVINELSRVKKENTIQRFQRKITPLPQITKKSREELLEEYLLVEIVQYENPKTLFLEIIDIISENDFINSVYKKIFTHLKEINKSNKNWDSDFLFKNTPAELLPTLDRLYIIDLQFKKVETDEINGIKETAKELAKIGIKRKLKEFTDKIKEKEVENDNNEVEKLSKDFQILQEKLKNLQDY